MADEISLETVTRAQQYMWSEGNFANLATGLVIVGEVLCEALDVLPGDRVLDVACGSGTAALAAARRGGAVTGVDYVPALLERGRERAAAERVVVEWIEGDAQSLPLEEGSFDIVLSTFGSAFAPDHRRAADELLRVCRSGGLIGMSNWTPDGLMGEVFQTIFRHAPPPVALQPPGLWGVEGYVGNLLADGISSLEVTPREFVMRARSAEHWLAFFRENLGPLKVAFARVGAEGEEALGEELLEIMRRRNRAGGRALAAPAAYIDIVARRR